MSTPQYPVSYLIGRTRALLQGTSRVEANFLGANAGANDANLTISINPSSQGAAMIEPGDVVCVDDESMYVTAVTGQSSGSTIAVQRGWYGTTAAAHMSGAIVYINPYYSQFEIRNSLMDEIRSWGPQVYAVKTVELTTTDLVNGYDLGALGEFYGIIAVRISPDALIGEISDKSWPDPSFEVLQDAPTSDFPSGNALIITQPDAIFDSPRTLHVVYAAAFNVDSTNGAGNPTFQDGDDLIGTVGVALSDLDIAPLGAAWRLILNAELRRDQPEPMGTSGDLQAYQQTASMRVADMFKQLRDDRLHDAQIRLKAKHPVVRR